MTHGFPADRAATVVVADDEAELRTLVRLMLERDGFRIVAEAVDGAEAVAAVAAHQPDVLLLDLRMPGVDGTGALPRIVREAPRTMVVVLSGLPAILEQEPAMALGAFAYLEKNVLEDGDLATPITALLAEFRKALDGVEVVPPVLRANATPAAPAPATIPGADHEAP